MTDVMTLTAELRRRAGTGGAREARRGGKIPAVIYGNAQDSLMISLDGAELAKHLRRPGFLTHVFEIDVGGRKERVLPRDVQQDPVSGRPLHVDFMRFSAGTKITVEVEVHFDNEDKAPGLKRGGVLNVVMRTIELVCSPDAIPQSVTVDLAGLEVGDVIHVGAVTLPAGAELADTDEDATIASIAAPSTEEAKQPAEEGESETAGAAD
jgi:large subunit ribosomal protein L25